MARQLTVYEKKTMAINILSDIRKDYEAHYKEGRDISNKTTFVKDKMDQLLSVIKSIDQTIEKLRGDEE